MIGDKIKKGISLALVAAFGVVAIPKKLEAQEIKAGAFLYEISITNNSDSLSKISSAISYETPANRIEKRNQCIQYQRKKDGANYSRMTDDEISKLAREVLIPKGKTELIFVTMDRSESCQNLTNFDLVFYRPTFADNAQTSVRDLNRLFKISHFVTGEVGVNVGDTRKFSLSTLGFDSQSSGIIPSWGGSEVYSIDLIGLSTNFHIRRNDGVRLDISTNEHCDFKKQQSNPCKIDFQINDNPKS